MQRRENVEINLWNCSNLFQRQFLTSSLVNIYSQIMNSTFLALSSISILNSSELHSESWFIPIDILQIGSCIIVFICSIIFLFIIAIDKTCHTVPMILVGNTCLTALGFAIEEFWMRLRALQNDIQRIQYQDPLCLFFGYLIYSTCATFFASFILQAFYRYAIVVYPTHLVWQSIKCQLALICLTWIVGFVFPLGFLFSGNIIYNVNNQICDIPFRLSAARIWASLSVYGIPVMIISFIYYKLIQYVKEMSKRVTPTNILLRAQREIKMARRTIIIVMFFLTLGVPYAIFIVISFFITPTIYYFRITYLFVDFSLACVMIVLFQFTDPLKLSIKKKLNFRVTTVTPAIPRTR